ncbi:protocatechuate 3,4-dioxygenase subunit alpha [Marinibaculum pumilum]|uniref:Protocatechuate 3,4-dioxygenase subunit alpha n=1 Tax=Marinibaculum pumilum TaxID=1766165 RepID=A0ABV7L4J3_9PROT
MTELLTPTAFHTTGPFFPPDFLRPGDNDLTWLTDPSRRAQGEALVITGRITEQGGAPRTNAVVELWQADAGGRFAHPLDPAHEEADPDFAGWGRTATDGDGQFHFVTVRPGAFRDPMTGEMRAPHLNLQILSSGLMRRLVTAIWFPDDPANGSDPVLSAVPSDRRGLLLATAAPESNLGPAGAACYRVDIALQGVAETPFFED